MSRYARLPGGMILVRRYQWDRDIPHFECKLETGCVFKLVKRRACDLSIIQESGWSPNLMVNGGLNHIMGASSVTIGCVVGSGNTPPTPTDSTLQIFVAGTTTIQSDQTNPTVQVSPKRYSLTARTYRFGTGVAAGNLSEVGLSIGGSGGATPLMARALIVDNMGVPTTITVLSDETLDVIVQYYKYAPDADIVGNVTITIDGTPTNHTFTARPAITGGANGALGWSNSLQATFVTSNQPITSLPRGCGASNGALGPAFDQVLGTTGNATTHTASAYTSGTFLRDTTITFGLNDGNLAGGIRTIKTYHSIISWQIELSPVIAKINTKTFTFNTRTTIASGIP